MRLSLPQRHVVDARTLFVPAAALVLDALPPLSPDARLLDLDVAGGTLTKRLTERGSTLARVVSVNPRTITTASEPRTTLNVQAEHKRLPFASGSFDIVTANLVLGDIDDDQGLFDEIARVVRHGGWLLASVLLATSFEELFDVLLEACEVHALVRPRLMLQEARQTLPTADQASERLFASGLSVVHVGEEERAIVFDSAHAALQHRLIREVLLPSWLQSTALPEPVMRHAEQALMTYLGDARFCLRVKTGIITARTR